MNEELATRILQEILSLGVEEFIVCPGGRNAPFCFVLKQNESIATYYWHEERSASFFALGRSKATNKPAAVIVTSGTAAGELLPAAMEAHYSGIPLILVTADRPRALRNSGAPQTADQVNLYGCYVECEFDIEGSELLSLQGWTQNGPCHINVCFDEPRSTEKKYPLAKQKCAVKNSGISASSDAFECFLKKIMRPLVMVGTIKQDAKESVCKFLEQLNAPVYVEGISLLREEPRLQHLRHYNPDYLLGGFDSIIRIGGIPTHRAWRDLEEHRLPVFSISGQPYKGLSHGEIEVVDCASFFHNLMPIKQFTLDHEERERNAQFALQLKSLLQEEPCSEPSLVHALSELIPVKSHVYLGNSMPIRNWDLAATYEHKQLAIHATRGLNGIDGQLSSFLGLVDPHVENWAIFGDLTTLYDLSAPWILPQLAAENIKFVIINNFGGRIFARKFKEVEIQNLHNTNFEAFAKLWQLPYERWEEQVPDKANLAARSVVELVSNFEATERFWKRYNEIKKGVCLNYR